MSWMGAHVTRILPPNATPVERNIATAGAAIERIPVPIRDLGDGARCPASVLPFLAWERSVDRWDSNWSEGTKRAVIDASFFVHQRKGTVGAIRRAIEPLGYLIRVVPWYDMVPEGPRGTFHLDVGVMDTGITEEMYAELERLIDDAKPLSRHLTGLAISVETRGVVRYTGAPLLGDVITVYPYSPQPVEVSGAAFYAGAAHLVDTITVNPL
ncbi:phage tail protein I [Cupriavidus pauculus]|uniref:phage tail protein I n=1 Tax=Cupriavidus pauculus TaxID=82633 RepID=UPI0030B8B2C4